ncbi:PilO protein (type 4 fimbrial biogenesis protein PilO) [mine drainage metagenome]|uniref:PilO protein (Type 4 fimbrial biogenesis protein PilO) n=1 Tax=mine drainage metagenome TaxID=410659 RepID=T1D9R6_9ZZZZ
MSFLDDFRNLDRNNIGAWPNTVKTTFTVLVLVVILFFGWWFHISNQQDNLTSLASREDQLKQQFIKEQARAVNLDALKKQLSEMQDMLRQMLRQLPSKTEMPELLVDISQTALSAGLQTDLFQPEPESVKEFYAEKPIKLKMIGTYNQFGTFISGVASLPRVVILTMHNVSLRPLPAATGSKGPSGLLQLEGTVRTYRYLEEDEGAKGQAEAGKGGK